MKIVIRFKKISSILFITFFLNNCSTVAGTVEGAVSGAMIDTVRIVHYSTCIFTKIDCI